MAASTVDRRNAGNADRLLEAAFGWSADGAEAADRPAAARLTDAVRRHPAYYPATRFNGAVEDIEPAFEHYSVHDRDVGVRRAARALYRSRRYSRRLTGRQS